MRPAPEKIKKIAETAGEKNDVAPLSGDGNDSGFNIISSTAGSFNGGKTSGQTSPNGTAASGAAQQAENSVEAQTG